MTGSEARDAAAALVAELRAVAPGALSIRGADLGPALEQQLFFRLRAGDEPSAAASPLDGVRAWARVAGIAAAGLAVLVRPRPEPGGVVSLVRQEVHLEALALIAPELRALGGPPLHAVRIGPAAGRTADNARFPSVAIQEVMDARLAPVLAAYQLRLRDIRPTGGVTGSVAALARRELARVAAAAIGVESVVRRYRPTLIASFDEVGTWARVIPAVGRRVGIQTLDLPHAEAADPDAIEGAGYDAFAVYGPQARRVMEEAGIGPERIHEIGAPRFDPLVAAAVDASPLESRSTVVFAAQYVTGRMTADALAATYRAAMAAAAATGSDLVVVPHPAEPPGMLSALIAAHTPPAKVEVHVGRTRLAAALADARLLVTGWSNSVMEAAIAGVPSITVNPGGVAPVDFAAEGLSVGASDEATAAGAAAQLREAPHAARAVERARERLVGRIGPLDGRASERAAHLIRTLVRGAG